MADTIKRNKWSDPEYRKEWFRMYYHSNKHLKNKPRVIENENWTKDPNMKSEYNKLYKQRCKDQSFQCEVCGNTINRCTMYNHVRTKYHLNALRLKNLS